MLPGLAVTMAVERVRVPAQKSSKDNANRIAAHLFISSSPAA
jgi:hypothetical protein